MGDTVIERAARSRSVNTSQALERLGTVVLLALIVALGAYFRFTGLDWGESFHLHPDERFMINVTSRVSIPESFAAYLNTDASTLNPNNVGFGFYVYGNFPLTVVRAIAEAVGITGYGEVHMVGRTVSAMADLTTIVLVFALGLTLFDRRIGLLGALLYASAALPIQLSHFWTVDAFTTTLTIAALLIAALLFKRHSWPLYGVFGLFFGLALASKLSAIPMALVLMLALGLRVMREWDAGKVPPQKAALRAVIGLCIAGALTVLVFRVAQPYAFLPPQNAVDLTTQEGPIGAASRLLEPLGFAPNPAWLQQIESASVGSSRVADAPPNHQWRLRTPILWPLGNIIYPGLGVPLGVFAWACVLWAGWEIARRHQNALMLALPLAWTVLIMVYEGTGWVKVMRYFHPIYPTLALLAGWGVLTLWDRVTALLERRRVTGWHWAHAVPSVVGAVVLIGAVGWGYAVSRIYTRPLTRLEASRWIVENVPSDFTLVGTTANGDPSTIQLGLRNDWSLGQDEPTAPTYSASRLPANQQANPTLSFTPPEAVTLSELVVNRAFAPNATDDTTLAFILNDGTQRLGSVALTTGLAPVLDGARSYRLPFDEPITLQGGQAYTLTVANPSPHDVLLTGSVIAVEGAWDDPVPQAVDDAPVRGALFHELKFEMAWEDTPEKRARMLHVLDEADYITISSNRFYDSLSRNPQRWPMTIRYYDALFSGELGFRLVGDFTSRPNIGPIEFYDDEVDEAWTVYDHPRVFIFEKTAAYNSAEAAAILNSVDLDQVVRKNAAEAEGAPVRILRPDEYPDQFVVDATAQTGEPLPSAPAQLAMVGLWWAAIAVLGAVAVPILFRIFPGVAGRGYGLARITGLLTVGWLAWLLASLRLVPWGRLGLLLALLSVGVLAAALVRPRWAEFRAWLHANRQHILLVEGIFALLFVGFVGVRIANPDLWHPFFGGEKPMDLAYFNAVLNTRFFPPADPWFAGGTINYYYFGFVLAAVPTELLGFSSSVAYNLLIPTFFALTGVGLFSAGHMLTAEGNTTGLTLRRGLLVGLLAVLFGLLLGNLDQFRRPLWALAELGAGESLWAFSLLPQPGDVIAGVDAHLTENVSLSIPIGDWYWNATRLIPVPLENGNTTEVQPITEFPMFTFLYADLHAHMLAFPLTLLVLAWGFGMVRSELEAGFNGPWLAALGVGALAAGSLIGTNTWDVPTYFALGAGFIVLRFATRTADDAAPLGLLLGGLLGVAAAFGTYYALITTMPPNPQGPPMEILFAAGAGGAAFLLGYVLGARRLAWRPLLGGAFWAVLWAGVAFASMLPYMANYRSGYTGFIPWAGSHTPIWAVLIMLGLPLFVIVSWFVVETLDMLRDEAFRLGRAALVPLIVAAGLAVVGIVWLAGQVPIAPLVMPLLLWAALLYARPSQTVPKRLTLILVMTAAAIMFLVELVVLRGDISRMNTVFKFYLQVWFLLATAAAAALLWVAQAQRSAARTPALLWRVALGGLIFLAALYPLTATQAKITDRWAQQAPVNLDGMVYMPYAQTSLQGTTFTLDDDYHALRWLRDNVEGTPTMLEGRAPREYLWGGRVSVYTGYPSVVGWNWHQRQQRPWQSMEVWARVDAVNQAYNAPTMADALTLFDRYNVDMVIVGGLERAVYAPEGIAKFEEMARMGYLTPVFQTGETTIYRVEQDAIP